MIPEHETFHLSADLPGMKMRTTHRMSTDTLNSIIKMGAGLKKKKKKGKKVGVTLIMCY